MATLACRVQFLDDTDPFNSTNFPEPSRPPLFTFREDLALGTQLAGVHRLLRAPHKVRPAGRAEPPGCSPCSRESGGGGVAGRLGGALSPATSARAQTSPIPVRQRGPRHRAAGAGLPGGRARRTAQHSGAGGAEQVPRRPAAGEEGSRAPRR